MSCSRRAIRIQGSRDTDVTGSARRARRHPHWGYAGAQVVTEALRRMPKDGAQITRDRFVEALESIRNWRDSLIPVVTIGRRHAPEHFLIREMSWLQVKGGEFVEYHPRWAR